MNYGDIDLGNPDCIYGYSWNGLKDRLPSDRFNALRQWMVGQTVAICDGRSYDHVSREYSDTNCGPHGPVVYSHDLQGWTLAAPIID